MLTGEHSLCTATSQELSPSLLKDLYESLSVSGNILFFHSETETGVYCVYAIGYIVLVVKFSLVKSKIDTRILFSLK